MATTSPKFATFLLFAFLPPCGNSAARSEAASKPLLHVATLSNTAPWALATARYRISAASHSTEPVQPDHPPPRHGFSSSTFHNLHQTNSRQILQSVLPFPVYSLSDWQTTSSAAFQTPSNRTTLPNFTPGLRTSRHTWISWLQQAYHPNQPFLILGAFHIAPIGLAGSRLWKFCCCKNCSISSIFTWPLTNCCMP